MQKLGLDIGGTSIKLAITDGDTVITTSHGPRYSRPSRAELLTALKSTLPADESARRKIETVGLCVPGIIDARTSTVTASLNHPGLVGVVLPDLIAEALGHTPIKITIVSDARAAVHDFWASSTPRLPGRLLGISLGTGVGASVLDEGRPLIVSATGPGHLGAMDVSFHESGRVPPRASDGAIGTLEAYIGLPALIERYGPDLSATLASLTPSAAPITALIRAIRITHAMYRPDHIALLGGVGLALTGLIPAMREHIANGLTSLAKPNWTLSAANTDLHAALGAARLA